MLVADAPSLPVLLAVGEKDGVWLLLPVALLLSEMDADDVSLLLAVSDAVADGVRLSDREAVPVVLPVCELDAVPVPVLLAEPVALADAVKELLLVEAAVLVPVTLLEGVPVPEVDEVTV